MTTTSNLGLTVYPTPSGSSTLFQTYIFALAGTSSNMSILDNWAGSVSGSIIALTANEIIDVNASQISANYYEATVSLISSYATNLKVNIKTNAGNTGAVTININGLGTKTLKKVDSTGTLVDLASGDIVSGAYGLFIYNGTYFVLIGALVGTSGSGTITGSYIGVSPITVTGSQISHAVSGVASGSYNQVLVNSFGLVTAGSIVSSSGTTYTGSAIITVSGSKISHNASIATAGSYLAANITVDAYGHITSAANGVSASSIGAPSDSPFLTSGSSANLTNYKVLTAGSNVTFTVAGSYIAVNSSSSGTTYTGSAIITVSGSKISHNTSGVSSGSFNQFTVDLYGHITSASFITITSGSGGGITGAYVYPSGSSTGSAIARYSGTSGSVIKSSVIGVDDAGNIINYNEKCNTISGCGTKNIDWSTGNIFEVTMTGTVTLTFSSLVAGKSITLLLIQDGSGNHLVTWPTVKWASGVPPTLSTTGLSIDIITLFVGSDGTTIYGFLAGLGMS